MRLKQLGLILAGLLALAKVGTAAAPVAGRTYYASIAGSDNNAGTLGRPFRTVYKGVSVLKPGDTLYIRSGTYAEALLDLIPSGTSWSGPVTVAAYAGEAVTLKPGSGEYVVKIQDHNPAYIILDGLILDGAGTTSAAVFITTANGPLTVPHHIRLVNCEIKNAREQGIMVYSPAKARSPQANYNEFLNLKIHDIGSTRAHHGFYINTNHNVIDHCEVWNVYGYGIHIYRSGGRNGLNCNHNRVSNCRIHDTGLDTSNTSAGIVITVGDGNLVYNNVLWNNFIGVQIDTGATSTKVYTNTIYKSFGDAGIRNGYPNPPGARYTLIRNNILYQNTNRDQIMDYGPATVKDHNLVGGIDPKFVNAADCNFHIQAGSPAIDAGTTLQEVTTDTEGVRRPQGRAYDIGAYEYVPPATQSQGGGTEPRN